jgi:hypothetical protein
MPPVFKISNLATGQFVTSVGPGKPVKLQNTFNDANEQKW